VVKLAISILDSIAKTVTVPTYLDADSSCGIVHFGVGGFHRSHEAMYVDRLLQLGKSNGWSICGVGVLAADVRMRDVLHDQDNLYTLVVKSPSGVATTTVIGSISEYMFAPDDPEAVVKKLAHRDTRIVSLTITEGGYSVSDSTGIFDSSRPDIAHDLTPGVVPQTVFGLITEALRRRREMGIAPFTVMSCDNIQSNGVVTRTALTTFATLKDPGLGQWISNTVSFPNSMVDRITPATSQQFIEEVANLYGIDDEWPVVSESFEQWVLEDEFTLGRPAFEDVGVQIVDDVAPYEMMKLRLLNASHQAMSYLGILAGFEYVHDVCRDEPFATFLMGYMTFEATPSLQPVPGINIDDYRRELLERFSSTAIADTLERQVVDGSERIPKFILPVLRDQLKNGGSIAYVALIIAAWSVYLEGSDEQGRPITIQDVRVDRLSAAVRAERSTPGAFLEVDDIFGDLGQNTRFRTAYLDAREVVLSLGSRGAITALNGAVSKS